MRITLACLLATAAAVGSSLDSERHASPAAKAATTYDVTFDFDGPLGLSLSSGEFSVLGFTPTSPARGRIHLGDKLVAINELSVSGRTLTEVARALSAADTPKTLRFSSPERVGDEASAAPAAASDDGLLQVTRAGLPLLSLKFSRAAFGGAPTWCVSRPLVWADPPAGCGAYKNEVSGALVLVARGGCSFSDKAILAQSHNAAGLLVVNGDGEMIRMPAAPEAASLVYLPAAMISHADGAKLLSSGEGLQAKPAMPGSLCKATPSATSAHVGSSGGATRQLSAGGKGTTNDAPPPLQRTFDDSNPSSSARGGEFLVVASSGFPSGAAASVVTPQQQIGGSLHPPILDEAVDAQAEDAWLAAQRGAAAYERGEYMLGTFGAARLPIRLWHELVIADPFDACGPPLSVAGSSNALAGKALLVGRGACPVWEKAAAAAAAGVAVLVVTNDRPGLGQPVGIPPQSAAAASHASSATNTTIVMVPQRAGDRLRHLVASLPAPAGGSTSSSSTTAHLTARVSFRGREVVAELWDNLSGLEPMEAWPGGTSAVKKQYMRAARLHHPDSPTGSVERFDELANVYEHVLQLRSTLPPPLKESE